MDRHHAEGKVWGFHKNSAYGFLNRITPTSSFSNILASADQNADEASAKNIVKVNFSKLDKITELAKADLILV
jgi:hypothetical protein